jgi:hypothetical protein
LDSGPLRRRMGAMGKDRTLAAMNWDAEKTKLLTAYETALRPKPRPEAPVARTAKPEPTGGPSRPLTVLSKTYYAVKPLLPVSLLLALRRRRANSRRQAFAGVWPIDERAGATPPGWPGWPGGKRFAVVLTHDVEGSRGLGRVERLMDLELSHSFRSSFNFVPEGEYRVPEPLRRTLERGWIRSRIARAGARRQAL